MGSGTSGEGHRDLGLPRSIYLPFARIRAGLACASLLEQRRFAFGPARRDDLSVDWSQPRRLAAVAVAFAVTLGATAVVGTALVLENAPERSPVQEILPEPDLFAPRPELWAVAAEGTVNGYDWRYEQTVDGACWRLFLYEEAEREKGPSPEVHRSAECAPTLQDPAAEAARLARRLSLLRAATQPMPLTGNESGRSHRRQRNSR